MPEDSARQRCHEPRHLGRWHAARDGEFVPEPATEHELGQGCFRRSGDDELGTGGGSGPNGQTVESCCKLASSYSGRGGGLGEAQALTGPEFQRTGEAVRDWGRVHPSYRAAPPAANKVGFKRRLPEVASVRSDLLLDALLTGLHPASEATEQRLPLNRYERDLLCRGLEGAQPALSTLEIDSALARHPQLEPGEESTIQRELELLGALAGPSALPRMLAPFLVEQVLEDPPGPRTCEALGLRSAGCWRVTPSVRPTWPRASRESRSSPRSRSLACCDPFRSRCCRSTSSSRPWTARGSHRRRCGRSPRLGSTCERERERERERELAESVLELLEDSRESEAAARALAALEATECVQRLVERSTRSLRPAAARLMRPCASSAASGSPPVRCCGAST